MTTITRRKLGMLALLIASGAYAQAPATGPVRITSVFATGSGPDSVSRLVGEKLQAKWQRPVVTDAKPGGAGMVAINTVKGAVPNGSELVLLDVGNLSINPLIFKNLSYDPEKDLVPVGVLYKTAFVIVVAADGPYKSMKDLFAAAGDKSRKLSFGSNAVGGPIHLHSERLASSLGSDMIHVPFKEISQLYTSVSTGEVNWAFGSLASTGPLVRAGRLRVLAIADAARSPVVPDVPTLSEAGGPKDLYATSWVALMAPRGTPSAVVADINRAVNDALAQPDLLERLASFGFASGAGPVQQVTDLMRADRARYAEVVKRLNITVD
jgi:tripartite-type tricarboxylate transporter receptor subunit TctC